MSSTKKRNFVQGASAPRYYDLPVAKFLRKIKEIHGVTDKQIADKIGAHYQNVQDWRSGKSKPHRTTIRQIAVVYGVSETELLAGVVRDPPVPYAPASRTPREKRIMDNVEKLLSSGDERLINHIDRQLEILLEGATRSRGHTSEPEDETVADDPLGVAREMRPNR